MKTARRLILITLLGALAITLTAPGLVLAGATPPDLGTAGSFGVLAGSAVTNTGPTTVDGNVGVSPGTSVGGFPPGKLTGTIHEGNAVAAQAQTDASGAYDDAAQQACDVDLTGQNLGALTLIPGVYCFNSSAQLTGQLTLDGQGDPDSVFIFKIGSTLTTASNASVSFIGEAQPCNVFWQLGSSATLGTNTDFAGNILALTTITLNTGASVAGGLYALNGAITLDSNDISACDFAPGPIDTPTPAPTDTPAATATATSAPATNTPAATSTATAVPSTATSVPGATNTPVPPATNTPVLGATNTPGITPRPTDEPTEEPDATNTALPDDTPVPNDTATSIAQPTESTIPNSTSTPNDTPISNNTATAIATGTEATATDTIISTPAGTATDTVIQTATPTSMTATPTTTMVLSTPTPTSTPSFPDTSITQVPSATIPGDTSTTTYPTPSTTPFLPRTGRSDSWAGPFALLLSVLLLIGISVRILYRKLGITGSRNKNW